MLAWLKRRKDKIALAVVGLAAATGTVALWPSAAGNIFNVIINRDHFVAIGLLLLVWTMAGLAVYGLHKGGY